MKQRTWLFILMAPPTLWLVLLFVVPLATMVLFTFRAESFGAASNIFTLAHYQEYFSTPSYQRVLWNSMLIALVVSVCSVILAYPLAYFLIFRAGKLRFTYLLIVIVPAWISLLLRVFAWKLVLGSSGLLNGLLLALGLIHEPTPILLYSQAAVIVALVYVYVPFIALPIFAALQRIDPSLLEAAADLGSSFWSTFFRVVFPLSLPGVMAGFFLVFIPSLGEYVTPLLVGGTQSMMYGNLIYNQFAKALNWPLGSLMSVVMLVITLGMVVVFTRLGRISEWVEH